MASKTRTHQSKPPAAKLASIKTARGRTARKMPPAGKTRAKTSPIKSSREKVGAYRQRMRAKGFRLIQMWLPDTRTPEFAALAHQASLAIANSPTEQDDQAFIDSVSWLTSEENA